MRKEADSTGKAMHTENSDWLFVTRKMQKVELW